jgi:hypothetical protein
MIEAYFDESGIHDGAKVCVIAGYFGDQDSMKSLELEWLDTLNRFHFPVSDFHAKDLLGTQRHNDMLMALAKTISNQSSVYSLSQSIVVEDFFSFSEEWRRWLTGGKAKANGRWTLGGCPRKPYYVPFQTCLQRVTDRAPEGGRAHFFFGLDRTFAGYALDLFARIKKISQGPIPNYADWRSMNRLGMPSFPLASETAQLQAADLLVHLVYQRGIACTSEDAWRTDPISEMLKKCMQNTLDPYDHTVFTRNVLQDTINLISAKRVISDAVTTEIKRLSGLQ